MKTDLEIQKDVLAELRWEPSVDDTQIGVAVHNGVVTLSGYVNFYSQKLAAEKAAKRVKGVKAVAEDIQVKLSDGKPSDSDIAESVVRALEWNTTIPDERLKVKVDDGWVTLEGEVDWLYQKEGASSAITFLNGVRGISNGITVKPRVNASVIKEDIREALERNADLEASNINIDAVGGKVILKGTAHSWNERNVVEKAAKSAPGVTEIDDRITIMY